MKKIFLLQLLSLVFLNKAFAIPPPDILLSTLQSIMQFFGIAVVFLISLFFIAKDFFKNIWMVHRKKCLVGSLALIVVMGIGLLLSFS